MSYPVYEEKQWNYPVFGILLIAIFGISMMLRERSPAVWLGPSIMSAVALCFANLTTTLTADHLSWHFMLIRLPGWRIALRDIASAEVSQSGCLEGWGIRRTRSGMLYNVSGTGAIRLYLQNGKTLRLGTRDPQRWMAYLQPRLTDLQRLPS